MVSLVLPVDFDNNLDLNPPDTTPQTTLWVGTSCGSVVIVSITMPDNMDNRELCLQTVLATPSRELLCRKC